MQLTEDRQKQLQLDRMRAVATGLLVVAAIIFFVTQMLEGRYPWLGYIRATSEAAMVGAIADWFAVTALFRYPLGIPIPHTAIVPRRKDRIGAALGRFVENNFLSREVLTAKIMSMEVGQRLAEWLQKPESAARLAGHATDALGVMIRALPDDEMERLIEGQLAARIDDTAATPLLADALSLVLSEGRRQELFDGTLALLERLLEENKDQLRERIELEIPWWVPAPIDDKIYRKIVQGAEGALHDVRIDSDHPIRDRFNELVDRSVDKLKTSPELIARGEELKGELLGSSAMDTLAQRVWGDLKDSLAPGDGEGRSDLSRPIEQAIMRFGYTLREDEGLLARVNEWAVRGVVNIAEEYRHEAGSLISNTVAEWDPVETSRKIELQVGRDLQFIRINGTLVGGLVGLILYTVAQLM